MREQINTSAERIKTLEKQLSEKSKFYLGRVSNNLKVRPGNTATSTVYFGVTGKSSVDYGGGNADTACVRIEDTGGNNGYYFGIEMRSKRSGDVRLYCQDSGDDASDFVIATDNSGLNERLRITSTGEVRPGTNNTQDLGTSAIRWANIYTNDLHLSNEGKTNSVDGTWGDFTIEEGESDLYLINNRSGKKYKFNLTEVS